VTLACATVPARRRARDGSLSRPIRRGGSATVAADGATDGRSVSFSHERDGLIAPVSRPSSGTTAPGTLSRRLSLAGGCAGIASAVATTRALPATAGEVLDQLQALLADAEAAIEADPENDQLLGQRTFFENQVERVQLNASFVDRLRGRVERGETTYLQRLVFGVSEALWEDETYFWKNAMGCRVTRELLGEDGETVVGVCLAFGQESLRADDGGKAAIELRKNGIGQSSAERSFGESAGESAGGFLSYVSLSVPYGVRVSRIYEAGGELVYGFGYFDIRSPSGYAVRARVASRRDPMELVAINVPDVGEAVRFYENAFSMKSSAPLDSNPYAPKTPPGSRLMTFGEVKETVGILLQPVRAVEDVERSEKMAEAFLGVRFVVGGGRDDDRRGERFAAFPRNAAGCLVSVEGYESWETEVSKGARSLPFKYNEPPPVVSEE